MNNLTNLAKGQINGELVIVGSWRGDHTSICNTDSARLGVSTDTCKNWLSIAMTAYVADKTVTVKYSDAPSCATIQKYGGAPAPLYIMPQ